MLLGEVSKFKIAFDYEVYLSTLSFDDPIRHDVYYKEVKNDYYAIARPDVGWHEIRLKEIADDYVLLTDAIELVYEGWTHNVKQKKEYTLHLGESIVIEDSRVNPRDSSKTDNIRIEISLLSATAAEIRKIQNEELRNLSGMRRDSLAWKLATNPDDPEAKRFNEALEE